MELRSPAPCRPGPHVLGNPTESQNLESASTESWGHLDSEDDSHIFLGMYITYSPHTPSIGFLSRCYMRLDSLTILHGTAADDSKIP